jgi:hypothetical protein
MRSHNWSRNCLPFQSTSAYLKVLVGFLLVNGMFSVKCFWTIVCVVSWMVGLRFMVFNVTFKNISVISWLSVLLVEETWVPGENHRSVASHWQTLSHNVVLSAPCHERGSNSHLQWWRALITQVVVNPTTMRSRSRRLFVYCNVFGLSPLDNLLDSKLWKYYTTEGNKLCVL